MLNLSAFKKRALASVLAVLGLALALTACSTPSKAQVPSFLAPFLQRPTYSATIVGLAAPSTGAGDLACISGFAPNASHPAGIVRVKSMEVSGIDSTAQASTFEVIKRSTADSGGTPGGTNSTVTITNASPGVLTWAANGLANGQPIVLETSGTLPTGLTAGVIYYVVAAATNTFELATTPGGPPINTSSAGSGTQTAYVQPLGVPHDATDPPAYATVNSYTVVPTAGTTIGAVEAATLGFAAATVGVINTQTIWNGYGPNWLQKEVILRGATQQLCLNAPNAFTTAGPTLNITIRWTEQ